MSRRIRGVIVSTHDNLYPNFGGGALRTIKCAEEFKRRNLNVKIIAPADRIERLNGINIYWLHPPIKYGSQVYSAIKFNIRILIKFVQHIRDADIFFFHNTIAALSMPMLKRIFDKKFALDITDIHAEYLPIGKRSILERLATPLLLKIEYKIIEAADSITVATQAMKDHLVSKGLDKEKIMVVYDGVDAKNFTTEKNKDAYKNIIHLGTIDRQHGVEYLIHAIPLVVAKHPEAKFFIVGGGRELKNIINLAQNLNIYDNCVFTDRLPTHEAQRILKRCGIGVIPRPDNLPNRIVTTLKIYEYWGSGTAVVSSGLTGIKEISDDGENIILFKAGDVNDLADKIIYLLENQRILRKLQENSLIKASEFNWSIQVKKIVDFALRRATEDIG